jgi:hypothetical protein
LKPVLTSTGAAGLALEARQQGMEARVGLGVNGLDARGVIDIVTAGISTASPITLYSPEFTLKHKTRCARPAPQLDVRSCTFLI